jgi:hypothetical protein
MAGRECECVRGGAFVGRTRKTESDPRVRTPLGASGRTPHPAHPLRWALARRARASRPRKSQHAGRYRTRSR